MDTEQGIMNLPDEGAGFSISSPHAWWLRLLGLSGGIAVAIGLTWIMYYLIQSGEKKLDERPRIQMLDFVRVQRNEAAQRKERQLERPTTAQVPALPQQAQSSTQSSDGDSVIAVSPLPSGIENMDVKGGGLSISWHDGEYLPIVKVAPMYPPMALRRRLEGYCTVRYSVTAQGTVKNAYVEPGMCSNPVFERPSIEAALKFKYKPRVIDGEAIEVEAVRNKFTYKIEENEQQQRE